MTSKYDRIGDDYNETRKADSYLTNRLFYHLNPINDGVYLDIGCGTGNYTCALSKKGLNFIGMDPSKKMLEKANQRNKEVDWRIGTADKTDLVSNSIEGIIASLTIHHWGDLGKSFSELKRILKSTGQMVVFTSTTQQMKGYWLNQYFPKMMEDSITQMPSLKKVSKAMEKAGILIQKTEQYSIKLNLKDQFLYCGKYNPERYFDENVRRGISSFSSLSNQHEVKQGLSNLREDIDSGKIYEIMESYKNNSGDYLFIIGKNKLGDSK